MYGDGKDKGHGATGPGQRKQDQRLFPTKKQRMRDPRPSEGDVVAVFFEKITHETSFGEELADVRLITPNSSSNIRQFALPASLKRRRVS
ncbi:MAG: hypothetical protein ACLPSW_32660 [Roseiarcus sp.]